METETGWFFNAIYRVSIPLADEFIHPGGKQQLGLISK